MSSQDERAWAKRFVRAVFRDEAAAVQWTAQDEADLDHCIAAAGPYPRPTSDAAAVVAAIVADLRATATSESVTAHRVDAGLAKADRALYAASVLRELADRIEAAHLRPAEPAADLLRAVAEAVQRKTAQAACYSVSELREDAPDLLDLDAIIATVRAR